MAAKDKNTRKGMEKEAGSRSRTYFQRERRDSTPPFPYRRGEASETVIAWGAKPLYSSGRMSVALNVWENRDIESRRSVVPQ